MKIVLRERRGQQAVVERAFEQPIVRIGRDGSSCDVTFEHADWPMVSRRHAELRFVEGQYVVVDLESSFGTYLDGRRVTEPLPIAPGSEVRFGTSGPMVDILRLEPVATLGAFPDDHRSRPAPIVPQGSAGPASAIAATGVLPPLALEYLDVDSGQTRRVEIEERVLIGRDPLSAVPIASDRIAVSRRHAEITRDRDRVTLADLGSFNGTLLNGLRVTAPTPIFDGDQIQLGFGGSAMRVVAPSYPPVARARFDDEVPDVGPQPDARRSAVAGPMSSAQRTLVMKSDRSSKARPARRPDDASAEHFMQVQFNGKTELRVGRAADNDITLDGLQISAYHARFVQAPMGLQIEDLDSTNGVYLNDARVNGRRFVQPQDVVLIGAFVLRVDSQHSIAVFDTRSKTRIDVLGVTKEVPDRVRGGTLKLLDGVDLTIRPNEFVGLLGPSGAGKSTLLDALNGMRPPTAGRVLINDLDFYQHLDSLKQGIGYVPQDDIIHRQLTVHRTLYYVARLRLSRDVSNAEIARIIHEVLDVTGLSEKRDLQVSQLSGGQRKRVSIAVELITRPSIIFLDEPTSGLDPATEQKIMQLFRQIAESGRTVILTTHAMENVRLFDKIVILMRGKVVFHGAPQQALAFLDADSFKDIYDKLEAPVERETSRLQRPAPDAPALEKRAFTDRREQIAEQEAQEWRRRFQQTASFRENVAVAPSARPHDTRASHVARRRTSLVDGLRQCGALTGRYLHVLGRDRLNLMILLAQAPVIALLTWLIVGANAPRDFPLFMLALVPVWFGTSVAAREIVKERPVYQRERMVNLGLVPYVGSKVLVLAMIVSAQCVLLFGTMQLADLAGANVLPSAPGSLFGAAQLGVMVLGSLVGIALGLLISALVRTSEMATSLVPLILIPQILFSGLVGLPEGTSKIVGLTMPVTWSFDELKRLSGLDTLSREGSHPGGVNRGEGLYNFIEQENDRIVGQYRADAERRIRDYESEMRSYQAALRRGRQDRQPNAPELPPAPPTRTIPDDLSGYVNFLHPSMNGLINPFVLGSMFFGLVLLTLMTLRIQDSR